MKNLVFSPSGVGWFIRKTDKNVPAAYLGVEEEGEGRGPFGERARKRIVDWEDMFCFASKN